MVDQTHKRYFILQLVLKNSSWYGKLSWSRRIFCSGLCWCGRIGGGGGGGGVWRVRWVINNAWRNIFNYFNVFLWLFRLLIPMDSVLIVVILWATLTWLWWILMPEGPVVEERGNKVVITTAKSVNNHPPEKSGEQGLHFWAVTLSCWSHA